MTVLGVAMGSISAGLFLTHWVLSSSTFSGFNRLFLYISLLLVVLLLCLTVITGRGMISGPSILFLYIVWNFVALDEASAYRSMDELVLILSGMKLV